MTIKLSLKDRIESEVAFVPFTGCWIWLKGNHEDPQLKVMGKMYRVRRLIYEIYKGQIPENGRMFKTCGVDHCLNPEHLYYANESLRPWLDANFKPKHLHKRLERNIFHEPMSGCWLWAGRFNKAGYGTINVDAKARPAHRILYELYKGKIPNGLIICHHCDMPACVNPDHLYAGTYKDNSEDMIRRGRGYHQKTKNPARPFLI